MYHHTNYVAQNSLAEARERYRPCNLFHTFKSGYLSISVRASFSINGRTTLIRIHGNLNQEKYIQILKKQSLPFVETYHGGTKSLILQLDG